MKAMKDRYFARSQREGKSKNHRLTVHDSETGNIVVDRTYHKPIRIMDFDPTGRYLVTVGDDFLDVHDALTGNIIDSRPVTKVKSIKEFEPGSDRRLFTVNLETRYEGDSYMMIPIMQPEVAR